MSGYISIAGEDVIPSTGEIQTTPEQLTTFEIDNLVTDSIVTSSCSHSTTSDALITYEIENIPIVININSSHNFPSTSMSPMQVESLDRSNSEQNIIEVINGHAKEKLSIDKFFFWPKTLKRKGKKQTVRLPFMLTSSNRQNAEKRKIQEKLEKEVLKEERRQKRIEAKNHKVIAEKCNKTKVKISKAKQTKNKTVRGNKSNRKS
nr:unnamed protein product [Callosobruchus analis]